MFPFNILLLTGLVYGLKEYPDGGYAPQMGWNTWNKYGCNINESVIIDNAKKIRDLGLLEHGYEYIIIDDCYLEPSRDQETQRIVPDLKKFPSGMKYLTETLHDMGFKAGIYSSAGIRTCAELYPGSLGYEDTDAQTFADWGFDYLKYDNCFNLGQAGTQQISSERYSKMAKALDATGRQFAYSLCSWGQDNVWEWASTLDGLNTSSYSKSWTISWRITGDIYDSFDAYDDRCPCENYDCIGIQGHMCSMVNILEKALPIGQKAGPRIGWNDLDCLEVGNGGMSTDEYKAHFTLWAVLKSPLILGNDVTSMSEEDIQIILNEDLIAINQDESKPGVRMWKKPSKGGHVLLLVNKLKNSDFVVTLFNSGSKKENTVVDFKDAFRDHHSYIDTIFHSRELWTNETAVFSQSFKATVDPHLVKVWILSASHE